MKTKKRLVRVAVPAAIVIIILLMAGADRPEEEETPEKETVIVLEEWMAQPPEKTEIRTEKDAGFTGYYIPLDESMQRRLYKLCRKYRIKYSLLIAVAQKESRFDPEAESETGDFGMWQINRSNEEWLSAELGRELDMMDPYDNAEAAAFILSGLMDRYGDTTRALMAYNMGETGAGRLWEKGIERSRYSDAVQSIMFWYDNNSFVAKAGEDGCRR